MVQSLYKQPTRGLKNHMRNLDNYRQAVESPKSPKSWNLMGYFCLKITFLQLKHIQRIYPTLLSTSCVKIHQMTYVIFETICKTPLYIKVKIFRLATAPIKIHKIPHVIFGTKGQFFFKLCITLQCHETSSSVLFHLNLHMLWTKGSDQSANFQTFDCSHKN